MVSFTLVNTDGLPVKNKRVIINALGEWGYGITDHNGYVNIPINGDRGKIIIDGQTVYYGSLAVDALRIGL